MTPHSFTQTSSRPISRAYRSTRSSGLPPSYIETTFSTRELRVDPLLLAPDARSRSGHGPEPEAPVEERLPLGGGAARERGAVVLDLEQPAAARALVDDLGELGAEVAARPAQRNQAEKRGSMGPANLPGDAPVGKRRAARGAAPPQEASPSARAPGAARGRRPAAGGRAGAGGLPAPGARACTSRANPSSDSGSMRVAVEREREREQPLPLADVDELRLGELVRHALERADREDAVHLPAPPGVERARRS